jgi:hypothetical protein
MDMYIKCLVSKPKVRTTKNRYQYKRGGIKELPLDDGTQLQQQQPTISHSFLKAGTGMKTGTQ